GATPPLRCLAAWPPQPWAGALSGSCWLEKNYQVRASCAQLFLGCTGQRDRRVPALAVFRGSAARDSHGSRLGEPDRQHLGLLHHRLLRRRLWQQEPFYPSLHDDWLLWRLYDLFPLQPREPALSSEGRARARVAQYRSVSLCLATVCLPRLSCGCRLNRRQSKRQMKKGP